MSKITHVLEDTTKTGWNFCNNFFLHDNIDNSLIILPKPDEQIKDIEVVYCLLIMKSIAASFSKRARFDRFCSPRSPLHRQLLFIIFFTFLTYSRVSQATTMD